MSDIIRLLPDSVANQIAAGEVIQRPASVVKELMENAIDAGADQIKVYIKDAGRTLIQVTDNGCGMSGTDARMSFERHSTSKINQAVDLFSIRTMGFRGEALASIAAVSQVELKTKRKEDELGTFIDISASKVNNQEVMNCSDGTTFIVKNLFFNIPARRKFLKSNNAELKHIMTEFQRIALTQPSISFALYHNDTELFNLPSSNHRQRIISICGKTMNTNLISLQNETPISNIFGFIGKPESAKKRNNEQYFFVNRRFVKHPYLNNAVCRAYEKILPPEILPSYFIYIDTDPKNIDINIHPTKTEVKFEDEHTLWIILHAAVKESLGRYNIIPSLDFQSDSAFSIPVFPKNKEIHQPDIAIDHDYNPFSKQTEKKNNPPPPIKDKENLKYWKELYHGFEKNELPSSFDQQPKEVQQTLAIVEHNGLSITVNPFFQLKKKFILTSVKSGLMIIDQKRAHERILFEKFMNLLKQPAGVSQKHLFPQTVELGPADYNVLKEIFSDIRSLGFDIEEFGNNTVVINGIPSEIPDGNTRELLLELLEQYKNFQTDIKESSRENLALAIAKASSIAYGKALTNEEMRDMVDNLFACSEPNHSPDGKPVLQMIGLEELEKRFK